MEGFIYCYLWLYFTCHMDNLNLKKLIFLAISLSKNADHIATNICIQTLIVLPYLLYTKVLTTNLLHMFSPTVSKLYTGQISTYGQWMQNSVPPHNQSFSEFCNCLEQLYTHRDFHTFIILPFEKQAGITTTRYNILVGSLLSHSYSFRGMSGMPD